MPKGTPGSQRPRAGLRALIDALDDHISRPIEHRARARGWHVLRVPGTRDVVYRHPGFPRDADPDDEGGSPGGDGEVVAADRRPRVRGALR
ncbi:MAG: hypothetical protein AB7V23_10410 [Candidatus Nanopelagicales bacterium]